MNDTQEKQGDAGAVEARVAERRLEDALRFSGLVLSEHFSQLALRTVAVVSFSLFERWSTTVEEAWSLGVPRAPSDIHVHRNQTDDNACYVDSRSVQKGSYALLSAWHELSLTSSRRLADGSAATAKRSHGLVVRFARALEHSVEYLAVQEGECR